MSASNIERVALDWMAARMVREHIEKRRRECLCAHEHYRPDESLEAGGEPRVQQGDGVPCWKTTFKETSDRRDPETGEPLDMAWVPHRPPAEWCESCTHRQKLHENLLKARRREGALRASLTRICRARILEGIPGGNSEAARAVLRGQFAAGGA